MHLDLKDKKSGLLIIVLLLLFRIFIQLSLYQAGFISLTADEFGRTVMAARWSEHPHVYWVGVFLPLHSYVIGTALLLIWELLWVPRLITILTGVVSIVIMYLIASSLFENRVVGLLSAFFLSVNPAHIWLTGTPLTEMPNAMFVLTAVWAFVMYLKKYKQGYLFTAACALALANGLRFESWIISVLFSLAILGECFMGFARRKIQIPKALNAVIAAFLPWIFPFGSLIGNYIETQNLFSSSQAIQAYKFQWYGHDVSYSKYIETFLKIDPYLTFLGIIAIAACLLFNKKSKTVQWYVAVATIPLAGFILLHHGQVEPPGNYIRYFALFAFLFYPSLGYLWVISTQTIHSKMVKFGLFLFLGLVAFSQISAAFRFTNDPSAEGLAVGLAIREQRTIDPEISDRPVIIELSYWQYLAIEVGANDIEGVVYDREIDTESRKSQSLLLTDDRLFQSCLKSYNVSYIIIRERNLRDVVENKLQLRSIKEVNGYAFYPIRADSLTDAPADWAERECPLSYSSGH